MGPKSSTHHPGRVTGGAKSQYPTGANSRSHGHRLYCENPQCLKRTFVEQVGGLTLRYQRRTPALQKTFNAVAVGLAGKAGARLLLVLHQLVSWATLLHCLMVLPVPRLPTPQVLGVDDFSLRRGHRFATILIDAVTHRRVDVLPDRTGETLTAWLRAHPGVEVVCRDGSASYAQAVTDALPGAVQVSDRWHLWHGLGGAVEQTPRRARLVLARRPDRGDARFPQPARPGTVRRRP